MAANKHGGKVDPNDRGRMLEYLAKLQRRGYTQHEMQTKLVEAGYPFLSQPTIHQYLDEVRGHWMGVMLKEHAHMVAEKKAQYAELRATCWDAYDRSCQDSERMVEEWQRVKDEADEEEAKGKKGKKKPAAKKVRRRIKGKFGGIEDSLERMRVIITREGRLPANEYLRTILMTLQAECELDGLNEQQAQAPGTMVLDFNALAAAAAQRRGARMIEEKIASVGGGADMPPIIVEGKAVDKAKAPGGNGSANGKGH